MNLELYGATFSETNAGMSKSGVGYSSINTARSALSSYLTLGKSVSVGQLPLVKRFLKGVYNKKLIFPRYQQTWDVNLVLDYLKTLYIYMVIFNVHKCQI
jgi:hypothetical protein